MTKTLDKHCALCHSVYEGDWNGPYLGQIEDLISLGFYLDESKRNITSSVCTRTPECRQHYEKVELQLQKLEKRLG